MDLYVGRLPDFATLIELKAFFKGFDKQASFEIKRITGRDGIIFTFGIVSIPSERLAMKAIKRLHMKKYMDCPVSVREYEHRVGGNDRRQLGWRKKLWLGQERRLSDRRDTRPDKLKTKDDRAA